MCHTCCTRYSTPSSSLASPAPLFVLLIKQLQASAFIWHSFDAAPHRLHWHPFHGKLLHRLPLPFPLVSHLLCAPASHSPFHITQHSRSTSRTNGSVAIIQFPYAKPVDILRLPQQMAQFNPPSTTLAYTLSPNCSLTPCCCCCCSPPMFVCTCLARLLSL